MMTSASMQNLNKNYLVNSSHNSGMIPSNYDFSNDQILQDLKNFNFAFNDNSMPTSISMSSQYTNSVPNGILMGDKNMPSNLVPDNH